jgi:hypothetical protein
MRHVFVQEWVGAIHTWVQFIHKVESQPENAPFHIVWGELSGVKVVDNTSIFLVLVVPFEFTVLDVLFV